MFEITWKTDEKIDFLTVVRDGCFHASETHELDISVQVAFCCLALRTRHFLIACNGESFLTSFFISINSKILNLELNSNKPNY